METQAKGTQENITTLELTAHDMAFNTHSLSVPCSAQVRLTLHNLDLDVPHNFSLYENRKSKQKLFFGAVITGVKDITYEFTAPAKEGIYFFRCDIHPMQKMSGELRVV